MAEFALIDLIRERCDVTRADVRLGIGDDAALLAVPAGQLLTVSTDTLVAGVHFPHEATARDIGWKALAVNLSDLAAMGAEPAWATLALTLPSADARWVAEFADGFAELARDYRVALVGGDTTQGPLSITVTIHGFVPEAAALTRAGARAGDGVYVTGTLGDAAAGLKLSLPSLAKEGSKASNFFLPLRAGEGAEGGRGQLLERLHRPAPRIAQGLLLRGRATACIDVSDGLAADLRHICTASGVGAQIDAYALPASPELIAAFGTDDRRALQLAGGDDYELCFTVPDALAPDLLRDLADSGCAATRIGHVVSGAGVNVRDARGNLVELPKRGWEHFA
ncbi:MAG TPA: thiamine-phosphate kinase [Rudaea sp.]|nr:thiamine-phosphate kinase [Rudaea sp.]